MRKTTKTLRDQVAALETLAGLEGLDEREAAARNGGRGSHGRGKLGRGSGAIATRAGSGAIAVRKGSGAIAQPALGSGAVMTRAGAGA